MNRYEIYNNIPDIKTDCQVYLNYLNEHDCRNRMHEWVAKTYELDEMKDICEHGMVAGFHSLTYYTDTIAFYDKFAEEIWQLLYEYNADIGESDNIFDLLAQMKGSKNVGSDAQFKNLLCWFAVEETARMFLELIECEDE